MIDPKNVEFIAAVGRGTFGEVVHAKWDGMDVRPHTHTHAHTHRKPPRPCTPVVKAMDSCRWP